MRLGILEGRPSTGLPAYGESLGRRRGGPALSLRKLWDHGVHSEHWEHTAWRWVSCLAWSFFAVQAFVGVASAQISPGPLSRPHSKLEGSGKCLSCHDPKQGVAASKCFACHQPLEARVKAGKGLHARADHADCKHCHVEHQGALFELVFWGKAGKAAFDHSQTGYALAGRHARLACDSCHKTPSFLGAVTDCASCHKDPHRGEFPQRACSSCHSQEAWRPAPGFDHGKTTWPLTGRHTSVGCDKCHVPRQVKAGETTASDRTFRTVTGRECASCHEDSHKGRLGRNCSQCHTTTGWRGALPVAFDHSRTAYPLKGRHVGLACEKCHLPGRPLRARHDRCTDCHADAHGGQLSGRADGGRCESCHDVTGFLPARFGPEEHSRTAYPLEGAHLAVACNQCHTSRSPARRGPVFRLAAKRCVECHDDPHGKDAWSRVARPDEGKASDRRGKGADAAPPGRTDASPAAEPSQASSGTGRSGARGECEACHRVLSWRQVSFDHAATRFALSGRHARVTCVSCHRVAEPKGSVPKWRFAGLSMACAACHRDPHEGQFVSSGGPVACERCHTTNDTRATGFDHARDSAYALDGAHKRLDCAVCHRIETRDERKFVRYKPLPKTCRGCHGKSTPPGQGGRP